MSRQHNFRKRKNPPEDLSTFIASKKRKIKDDASEDIDYSLDHGVVIYDEDSAKEVSSEDSKEVSSEDYAKEASSEDSKEVSSKDESFDPRQNPEMFEDIVDSLTKKIAKKRIKKINDDALEKLAENEAAKAKHLRGVVEKIQAKLEEEEPDIVKILSVPMTETEQKKIIQYYEIYQNMVENTWDHYELRLRLIHMLENYSKMNLEERERIDLEVKRIVKTHPPTSVFDIRKRIIELDADDVIKSRLLEMMRELDETPSSSDQYRSLKEKLEWGVSLPYRKVSVSEVLSTPEEINKYCEELRRKLDCALYGMDEVKEEMIAIRVNQLTKPGARSSLALEGPPGVGKTAICEAFAKAVNKPFERIALGGMRNSDLLKGLPITMLDLNRVLFWLSYET